MGLLSFLLLGLAGAVHRISAVSFLGPKGLDACTCKKWVEVYEHFGAQCGATNEFYLATQKNKLDSSAVKALQGFLGIEFCDRFFEKLQGNYCVNINMGADVGQWCYVSNECDDLINGEAVPGTSLSWKKCGAQDLQLRNYTPEELSTLSRTEDLDLGLLHKMSYPLYKGHLWKEVQAAWGISGSPETLPQELREEMRKIAQSGKPFSFDTAEDNHPPHRIVFGTRVYDVNPSPDANGMHPGSWTSFSCERGCQN